MHKVMVKHLKCAMSPWLYQYSLCLCKTTRPLEQLQISDGWQRDSRMGHYSSDFQSLKKLVHLQRFPLDSSQNANVVFLLTVWEALSRQFKTLTGVQVMNFNSLNEKCLWSLRSTWFLLTTSHHNTRQHNRLFLEKKKKNICFSCEDIPEAVWLRSRALFPDCSPQSKSLQHQYNTKAEVTRYKDKNHGKQRQGEETGTQYWQCCCLKITEICSSETNLLWNCRDVLNTGTT